VRLLLVALTLVALPLGWHVERSHRQERAVAELERLVSGMDGTTFGVSYETMLPFDWNGIPTRMDELVGRDVLRRAVRVTISSTELDDGMLSQLAPHLAAMPRLRLLCIYSPLLTDAALPALEPLTGLETLDLDYSQVTPEGIDRLERALPRTEIEY
jgi:hypothetical protein